MNYIIKEGINHMLLVCLVWVQKVSYLKPVFLSCFRYVGIFCLHFKADLFMSGNQVEMHRPLYWLYVLHRPLLPELQILKTKLYRTTKLNIMIKELKEIFVKPIANVNWKNFSTMDV